MLYLANTFYEKELQGLKGPLRFLFEQDPYHLALQFLPLLFLEPEARLVVSYLPSENYFTTLKKWGIDAKGRCLLLEEAERCSGETVVSWGSSQTIEEWADRHGLLYEMPSSKISAKINSKRWAFERAPQMPGAMLIQSKDAIGEVDFSASPQWVLKTEQGFSGRGFCIFASHEVSQALKFAQENLKSDSSLILEPWKLREMDFSSQWEISKEGEIKLLGVTLFHCTPSGRYLGTETGSLSELFFGKEIWVESHLQEAEKLVSQAALAGFWGHLGVDAMLYFDPDSDKRCIKPVQEVNARMTLSGAVQKFYLKYLRNEKHRFVFKKHDKLNLGLLPEESKVQLFVE